MDPKFQVSENFTVKHKALKSTVRTSLEEGKKRSHVFKVDLGLNYARSLCHFMEQTLVETVPKIT